MLKLAKNLLEKSVTVKKIVAIIINNKGKVISTGYTKEKGRVIHTKLKSCIL
jgi:hypothetical protein|uniref:Uncharacterized protein n=1 Tax=viral metagenome TaxID=1070528 RepID=A0A6C0BDC6_9ZZZZ